MTLSGFFYGIADFMQLPFSFLQADMIGNVFNYSFIVLGFVGLFFWLNMQRAIQGS
jgi:hypothetical protein